MSTLFSFLRCPFASFIRPLWNAPATKRNSSNAGTVPALNQLISPDSPNSSVESRGTGYLNTLKSIIRNDQLAPGDTLDFIDRITIKPMKHPPPGQSYQYVSPLTREEHKFEISRLQAIEKIMLERSKWNFPFDHSTTLTTATTATLTIDFLKGKILKPEVRGEICNLVSNLQKFGVIIETQFDFARHQSFQTKIKNVSTDKVHTVSEPVAINPPSASPMSTISSIDPNITINNSNNNKNKKLFSTVNNHSSKWLTHFQNCIFLCWWIILVLIMFGMRQVES